MSNQISMYLAKVAPNKMHIFFLDKRSYGSTRSKLNAILWENKARGGGDSSDTDNAFSDRDNKLIGTITHCL